MIMDSILELKGKIQSFYAEYSRYIDKAIQFILAFLTFYMIGREIGFMDMLKNPVIVLGLAVVCAFLPRVFTAVVAMILTLGHIYAASMGMMLAAALMFLLMFIFYLRLAPKTSIAVILMALAFIFKIPAVVPVAAALVATPVYAVPVALGTVSYYMIRQVKELAGAKAAEGAGFVGDMMNYVKAVLQNKEMWVMVIAAVICVLTVYAVKRSGVVHAWKIASVVGAAVYMLVAVAGDLALGMKAPYLAMALGSVAAIVAGFVLELFFFAVDYSKCENFQYEDDEYYYYVKAVPKVGVAASEKTVKRISRRDDLNPETEIIDSEELRKKTKKSKNENAKRPKKPQNRVKRTSDNTDHMLLTQSLERELNLDDRK